MRTFKEYINESSTAEIIIPADIVKDLDSEYDNEYDTTSLEDLLRQINNTKSKWNYGKKGTIVVQANDKAKSILRSYSI